MELGLRLLELRARELRLCLRLRCVLGEGRQLRPHRLGARICGLHLRVVPATDTACLGEV